METLMERQMALEEEMVGLGQERYFKAVDTKALSELPPGIALMKSAIGDVVDAIDKFMVPTKGGCRHGAARSFFRLFDKHVIAFIGIRRCLNAIQKDEPVQRVALNIVAQLCDQLEYSKYKEAAPGHLAVVERNIRTDHEKVKRRVILRAKRTIGIEDTLWDMEDQLHYGVKIIDLIIQATGLVKRTSLTVDGRETVILQATEDTLKWIEERHARCALLSPVYLPMLIKPRPWTDPFTGGFLHNAATMRHRLIKTRDKETLLRLAEEKMPEVYRAINALQDTPWQINQSILDVAQVLWTTGNGLAGLPVTAKEPLPPAPWRDDAEFKLLKETQPEVIKEWKRKAALVHEKWARDLSNRLATHTKLGIAQRFRSEDAIYFCWTMDFRGRMYPIQSMVNPQADDLGKGLLRFAEGKALGKDGWKWLQIHLANSFGVDKVSFADRLKWVAENSAIILECAENPLDTVGWWGDADSPFCFLAAALEYAAAVKSGSPETFVSYIPVGLDGSCNGLQHFSAALRDHVGGAATNLIPTEKPADIYSQVAAKVSALVEADAAAGDEMARLWLGKVDRGICKRGVMTTPYGVTHQGMSQQLIAELQKRGTSYLGIDNPYPAARYLTGHLWTAIGQVVVAAREAMQWLQECATVAGSCGLPIRWTTPVGLTVYQGYRKVTTQRITTFFSSTPVKLTLAKDSEGGEIDKRAGKNGIAPNWVHSLDAAHMTRTVNMMLDLGVTNFAMIHDSYGTHAADCETLATTLRKAFVALYQEDVLARFRDELIAQLPTEAAADLPPLPAKGNLDLEAVLTSAYFFA